MKWATQTQPTELLVLLWSRDWKVHKFQNFTYLEGKIKWFFYIKFWCVFFLWIDCVETLLWYVNRFHQSLMIFKTNSTDIGQKKTIFQNLNFLFLLPILIVCFAKYPSLWLTFGSIKKNKYVYHGKEVQILKFHLTGNYILFLYFI